MASTLALGVMLGTLGAMPPAAAGSWSFGVGFGFGPPVFWEPPPVYYDRPVIVHRRPPAYYYGEPLFHEPAGPAAVYRIVGPDAVFDMLDAAGYRELSPMARRGAVYKLQAVNPDGHLVALQISIFTGAIERADVIEARFAAPPPPPSVAAPPKARPALPAAAAPVPAYPPAAAPEPVLAPVPGDLAPAPMTERLNPVPPPDTGDERDPLVVY